MTEVIKDSKPAYLSRTLWLTSALVGFNLWFIVATFQSPVYATVDATLPLTPLPLMFLLCVNAVAGMGLIYLRHKTTKSIA